MIEEVHADETPEAYKDIVNRIAIRTGEPLWQLFAYYVSGYLPEGKNLQNLADNTTTFEHVYLSEMFYESPHEWDWSYDVSILEEIPMSGQEIEAINFILNRMRDKKNKYAQGILTSNSNCMEMLDTLRATYDLLNNKDQRRKYNYPEADAQAREETRVRHGNGDIDSLMRSDIGVRKEYLRKVTHYMEEPHFMLDKNKTAIPESIARLEQEISRQIKFVIEDLLEDTDLYVTTGLQTVKLTQENLQDLEVFVGHRYADDPRAYKSLFYRLRYRGDTALIETNSDVDRKRRNELRNFFKSIFITGNSGVKRRISEDLNYSIYDLTDLLSSAYISGKRKLDAEEVQKFQNYYARNTIIYLISEVCEELINPEKVAKKYRKTDIREKNPSILLQQILDRYETSPCDLISGGHWAYMPFAESARYFDMRSYIKWSNIFNGLAGKPFPDFDVRKSRGGFTLDDLLKSALQFGDKVEHILGKRMPLDHQFSETTSELMTARKVIGDILKLYVSPDFILRTGTRGSESQKKLSQIRELSTYPDNIELDFEEHILDESRFHDYDVAIYSRSVSLAGNENGKRVIRLYTPEYSRINYLVLKESKGRKLQNGTDYILQYERKTGHYRLVLVNPQSDKNTTYTYTAYIDPTEHRYSDKGIHLPGSNERVLKQISEQLWLYGYTQIGRRLDELIELQKNGKNIYSSDLTRAFRDGSKYSFYDKDDSNIQTMPYASYLPLPTRDGYSRVQCSHAAKLLSSTLNRLFGSDNFYSSHLFNTVQIAPGVVFAGMRHADVRGMGINIETGQLIRHDSTPGLDLHNLLDLDNIYIPEQIKKDLFVTQAMDIYDVYTFRMLEIGRQENHNLNFPRSVVQLVQLLDEMGTSAEMIYNDYTWRNKLMTELLKLRETWLLAGVNTINRKEKDAAKRKLFGVFQYHSSEALSAIDNAIGLMMS